jgi:hypothetical protein
MANGFFPVKELPFPPPTKLDVPLVFVLFESPFEGEELADLVPFT